MKKVKIGFLWHNVSSCNLGVGALAISHMIIVDSILKELNIEAEFYTIGDGEVTSFENHKLVEKQINHSIIHRVISIKKIVTNIKEFKKFKHIMNDMDYVFDNGAGDSFADIYGIKRFTIQAFTKIYSIMFNKKMILAPQTIGPFKSKIVKQIAKQIIKKSVLVFARDNMSFEVGNQLGNCKLSTDLALTMPFEKTTYDDKFIHVGLNVSGLLWNGGYTQSNQFGLNHSYKEFIEACIDFFLTQKNVKVHLVSHVIAMNSSNLIEDDYHVCVELQKRFPDLILAPRFTNAIEIKNYISGMDFFTGGRMHATIAAFSTGVAVVPYAYSRKFEGLYGTFDYNYVLDAKKLDLNEAITYLKKSFLERDELKKRIEFSKVKVDELITIYTDSLKTFFQKELNDY